MKGSSSKAMTAAYAALYPTWFRWKAYKAHPKALSLPSLYPTWFRWKPASGHWKLAITSFISHMVQMKGGGGDSKGLWCLTLYPTWFRWKCSGGGCIHKIGFHFISHMVQMKVGDEVEVKLLSSGFISHMVQMKVLNIYILMSCVEILYIPHGSDERLCAVSHNKNRIWLYIPHGSDERYRYL